MTAFYLCLSQESKWFHEQLECSFSKALTKLREFELTGDKESVASRHARFKLLRDEAETKPQTIVRSCVSLILALKKVNDLVQKALRVYRELQGDTSAHLKGTYLEGRSISSILRYNHCRLKNEFVLQFIFYQVICILECFQSRGVPYLNLTPLNVFVDDLMRVNIAPPSIQRIEDSARLSDSSDSPVETPHRIANPDEFSEILSGWVLRKISNYDYLMYINRLAGRKSGDPTASAVLPWVTDFSSPFDLYGSGSTECLRDLTRSKFRLTKGEHQLDATYLHLDQSDILGRADETFVPHHLLDMMPNLAYYTYKARQTPLDTLKRYVRSVYRPEEFPASLQRLYATTPEESIPEFFTDPSIFISIHADMPDLQLPDWFNGTPDDFLAYHRSILESDAVSANLHHWIDLTFGYKLIGEAAVSAKNVYLELVSLNPPSNSRVTCLFSLPHPRRIITSTPPEDLIPIYEEMSDFFFKICSSSPPEFGEIEMQCSSKIFSVDSLLKSDLEDLACLITEISVGANVPGLTPQIDNAEKSSRLKQARQLFKAHSSTIPCGFKKPVELLLFNNRGDIPLSLIRRCMFAIPLSVIDLHRIQTGLDSSGGSTRLEKLHFRDGPAPGSLLNVFLGISSSSPQRFDFPICALNLLTPMLKRAVNEMPACVVNALVSGRLINLYLTIGGQMAVERHLLPVIQRLLLCNSRLCSRRFVRTLFLSVRLPTFISTVPALLANSIVSSERQNTSLSPSLGVDENYGSLSDIEEAFFKGFLLTAESRESSGSSVPLVAVVQDSLHWLATSLGPLSTAIHLVPPLITALVRCYNGEGGLSPVEVEERATRLNYRIPKSPLPMPVYTSGRILGGDLRAPGVLRCLERLACLYGVEIITSLYLPFVKASVDMALFTLRSGENANGGDDSVPSWDITCEARLVASLVFLHQFVTYLPANQLMDNLQEPIISTCLIGALKLIGRLDAGFPSGAVGRLALLCKTVDCVYVLGVRLGFEIVRNQMTELIQLLFSLFDRSVAVSCEGEATDTERTKAVKFFPNSESDDDSRGLQSYQQIPQQQQQRTSSLFVVKLDRHTACLTVAKGDASIASGSLSNPTLVASSESIFNDAAGSTSTASTEPTIDHADSLSWRPTCLEELQATFTPKIAYMAYIPLCRLAGGSHIESSLYNIDLIQRLVKQHETNMYIDRENSPIDTNIRPKVNINAEYEAKLAASTSVSKPASTHLNGEWVDYFRTKAKSPSSTTNPPLYNFKLLGRRLISFTGHSGKIRSITPLQNNSSFITTSNDRSVNLFSLTSARELSLRRSSRRTTSEGSEDISIHRLQSAPPQLHGSGASIASSAHSFGTSLITPIFTFSGHRRAVLSSVYLHFECLVASMDTSLLLLWDPVTGQKVSAFAPSESSSEENFGEWPCVLRGTASTLLPARLTALASTLIPRNTILAGDEAGCLLVIDHRVGSGSTAGVLRLTAAMPISELPSSEGTAVPPIGRSKISLSAHGLENLPDKYLLNSPGALRCIAPRSDSNGEVLCGFSSGYMSQIDIRTGGVVATWHGHSDSVSQIFYHSSGWCSTTSTDRSIGFWRLNNADSSSITCHRFTSPLSSNGFISCACQPLQDSLFIAGLPLVPSSTIMGAAESSPLLVPSTTTASRFLISCCENVPLATSRNIESPPFEEVGKVLLRGGQMSVMAALPLAEAILTGSNSGQLSLFY